MNRKDKPLWKRVIGTISSFVLVGACWYAFFAGINLLAGALLAISLLSITTPVVIDGGGIGELISGVIEAFLEGLMGVIDAIASIF